MCGCAIFRLLHFFHVSARVMCGCTMNICFGVIPSSSIGSDAFQLLGLKRFNHLLFMFLFMLSELYHDHLVVWSMFTLL